MDLTRKEFLTLVVGGVAAAACGGSSSGSQSGGNCLKNGSDSTIGQNHGHSLDVSAADIAAGTDKTYDIRGTADHTHTVALTAAQMAALAANNGLTVNSTSDQSPSIGTHKHPITINCV